jgi:hypothetical protein
MNAINGLNKWEMNVLDRATKFAETLDIYGAEVRIDAGVVYLVRRIHGSDEVKFHNVGRSHEDAEWIEKRMKAVELQIK